MSEIVTISLPDDIFTTSTAYIFVVVILIREIPQVLLPFFLWVLFLPFLLPEFFFHLMQIPLK